MSNAPVRRKSRQALAAAAANEAARKPAPHQVILRIKRKRSDAAVENLFVATDDYSEECAPDRKRRPGAECITDNLAVLSLERTAHDKKQQPSQRQERQEQVPSRLCFKRSRSTMATDGSDRREEEAREPSTTAVPSPGQPVATRKKAKDGEGGGRLDALLRSRAAVAGPSSRQPAVVDYLEVRRVKAKAVATVPESGSAACESAVPSSAGSKASAPDFHVIDLHPVRRSENSTDLAALDGRVGGDRGVAVTKRQVAAPVLNPVERQMDEAIFKVRFRRPCHAWVVYTCLQSRGWCECCLLFGVEARQHSRSQVYRAAGGRCAHVQPCRLEPALPVFPLGVFGIAQTS